MKIAMIGPKRIPSREGGIDVVVGKLSTGMVEKGNDVTVFVRKKRKTKIDKIYKGVRVKKTFTVNKKSTDALVYSFFATLKGLFGKYDVLHFHASGNTFFMWLTRFSRKKIISTCHGIDWKRQKFEGFGTKILRKSEKRMVKYSDKLITLCKNDYDYFKETYGIEPILIPNGFEKFELKKANIIKEKFGLENENYILFLARIVPEKGLHYLIDAYKKSNIDKKLVVAGGDSHSKDYYDEMVKKADNNPNIIFTGFVQGEIFEELFSNAFLYVLPSDIEGMPLSLLEALGHNRVCLVSNISENNIDPINSYFFEKGNIDSLAEQLVNINKNRKNYQENDNLIDWNEVVDRTLKLYEETN